MDLTSLPLIDAAELERLVPMRRAIAVVEETLRSGAWSPQGDIPRTVAEVGAGQLLFMPARLGRYAGVKLAALAPGNAELGLPRISGLYVLLDAGTLLPLALLDAAALTSLRTPAVSAAAVRALAVPDAAHLVVFGTGPQALRHVEAVRAVRPISRISVVARHAGRGQAFAARCAQAGTDAAAAGAGVVADADIVVCCTTSREPLFPGRLVPGHATVVAVGSHEPDAREVDTELVRRSTLVVESRAAALAEAGDVIVPLRAGAVSAAHIAGDLADLVTGRLVHDPARPRLFKSVGMAWEDLAVAAAAYGLATGS
ncbi:ornithine cyclodeaminase family protein [Streptomyces sp. ISL-43]|uniref:ornithine cyclodeaminase family protein n=1 Tax=Streptomyces sp. ISL-43 TaxID=2819183 RepID=UPI001BEBB7D0|nr:ornithine cyclodeaminase family protein [Streptomyces sp. ISL-43]MBT2447852.1 ornithine cyclodeaminase family protein [Streptomyces sp. ISL-43]